MRLNIKKKLTAAVLSLALAGSVGVTALSAVPSLSTSVAPTSITAFAATSYNTVRSFTKAVDACDALILYFRDVMLTAPGWKQLPLEIREDIYGSIHGNGTRKLSAIGEDSTGTFEVTAYPTSFDYWTGRINRVGGQNNPTANAERTMVYYNAVLSFHQKYYKAYFDVLNPIDLTSTDPLDVQRANIRANGIAQIDALADTLVTNTSVLTLTENAIEKAVKDIFEEMDGSILIIDGHERLKAEYDKRVSEDLTSEELAALQAAYEAGDASLSEVTDKAQLSATYATALFNMQKVVSMSELAKLKEGADKNLEIIFNGYTSSEDSLFKSNAVNALNANYNSAVQLANEATSAAGLQSVNDGFEKYRREKLFVNTGMSAVNYTSLPEGVKYEDLSVEEKRVFVDKQIKAQYDKFLSVNQAALARDSDQKPLAGGFKGVWKEDGTIELTSTGINLSALAQEKYLSSRSALLKLSQNSSADFSAVYTDFVSSISGNEWLKTTSVEGKMLPAYREFIGGAILQLYNSVDRDSLTRGKQKELSDTLKYYQGALNGEEEEFSVDSFAVVQALYLEAQGNIKGSMPVWAIILIAVVGSLIILVGVFFLVLVLRCRVVYVDGEDGTIYGSQFCFPGSRVDPREAKIRGITDDGFEDEDGSVVFEFEDGSQARLVGMYFNKKLTKPVKRFKMPFKKKRIYLVFKEV